MASFQGDVGQPVTQCQTILNSAAARDDGDNGGDNYAVKSPPPPKYQHRVFYRLDAFPVSLAEWLGRWTCDQ